jgi:hypothetical protein
MPPKLRKFAVTPMISWVTLREMEFCRKPFCSLSRLALCLAAVLLHEPAKANDSPTPIVSSSDGAVSRFSWEADVGASGIARSSFEERGAIGNGSVGKVESLDTSLKTIGTYQASAGLNLRFGLEFQRCTFGYRDGPPLPDRLQDLHLTLGADFQLGDAWLVRFEAQPGFYGNDPAPNGRNLSCPIILGASYFVNADLQLVAGVSYDPDRKYPVLPGVGFRWKFAADWVMDAVLPTPRIEYSLTKALTLYAGADLRDDTYRMGGDFGRARGLPQLDDAVVDYTEVRVGAGATWKISSVISMEIESGCVLVDEFDFHRANVRLHSSETPPYGGISLKTAF